MKNKYIWVLSGITVIALAAIITLTCGKILSKGTASGRSGGGKAAAPAAKPGLKPGAAKPEKPREFISRNMKDGRTVVLYFYADQIKDSLDNYKKVEQLAQKRKAVVVKAEAYKEQDLSFDYGIEYVPSVFVIRPGYGISDTHIVDIIPADIEKGISSDQKPTANMESIKKGVAVKKPALVFFMADWCGYCRKTIPEVEKFKRDYGSLVNVLSVNIEQDTRIGDLYLVSGVPVLVVLDSNGAIYRRMGYPSGYKDFEKIFRELGIKSKK
jgi:thiol-disulfide isomerase/thioredoxin